MDLTDLCGLHILRCAECTRDLIELRKERERRLRGNRKGIRTFRRKVSLLWLGIVFGFALVGLWLVLRTS
jgi:hypothetical protein